MGFNSGFKGLIIVVVEALLEHFDTLDDTHTHTLGRTPLNERSTRHGGLYPHNTSILNYRYLCKRFDYT